MLIECGVNVVGRTRFCIHPQDQVHGIPAVGGTKDLNWERVRTLGAGLLLLDQEENLPWMKEQSPIPTVVTHVTDLQSVAGEISKIADVLRDQKKALMELAQRWEKIGHQPRTWDWNSIPAEMEVLKKSQPDYEKLVYVIWKNPWMRVAQKTFIDSVLRHLGAERFLLSSEKKYPEFQLSDFDLKKTYFLFSSEPFPFHKKKQDLLQLGIEGSIVDGESFSWFGSRSLRFLEKQN